MDQNTKDWLNRIEGKLDLAIASTLRNETDIGWLKGSTTGILMIILACASFIAARYFGFIEPQ